MDVEIILKTHSQTKVSEYIPSSFSISTIPLFRNIKNKHGLYKGKGCMITFAEFLRDHAIKKIKLKREK